MPYQKELHQFIESMTLSASGWRGVFANDNNPESLHQEIHKQGAIVTLLGAYNFYQLYKELFGDEFTIALGRDSRPTGKSMESLVYGTLTALGVTVHNCGIIAAPELMAYTTKTDNVEGFFYISASHNPPGYNGFKFGLKDGALEGKMAGRLISSFVESTQKPELIAYARRLARETSQIENPSALQRRQKAYKENAQKRYRDFSYTVLTATEEAAEQETLITKIQQGVKNYPISVVAEFNGSARSTSIDSTFLEELGIPTLRLQESPGAFIHPIVPEGENLRYCKEQLEEAYAKDNSFLFGYVPDCDGDRGNIVAIDPESGKAIIPSAQEVFALVVLAELTFMHSLKREKPQAVVVNGPTSRRIDAIAEIYGVRLYRVEVGEANVLAGARKMREEGYEVRILGEGANGGNITYPGTMRDPINTLTSLIKMLVLRGENGLFSQWCIASNQESLYREDFSLIDIIRSIPPYTTTNSYEDRALMQVKTEDHRALKHAYKEIFLREWEENKEELFDLFGVTNWQAFSTRGTAIQPGLDPFDAEDNRRGGLSIEFLDTYEEVSTVIWMRGSGTEPVFRIWADCKGNDKNQEKWFLKWHRAMILEADELCTTET